MPFLTQHDASANHRNLARLCWLRTILLAGLMLALTLADFGLGEAVLADPAIVMALLVMTLFNGWTLWRLRQGGTVREVELFVQLLVDVVLMTVILYRTGGSTNPFVFWYLVPLTIAAATLRLGYTVVLALLTLSAYSFLLFHYNPIAAFSSHMPSTVTLAPDNPHAHHQMSMHAVQGSGSGFDRHVFGMWLNFLLSAALITFFVSRMSHTLREQDRLLAEQRESILQREQVVSLGALAAGAAHELGTPLATMTVIAKDLEKDIPADSVLHEDVRMLRRQLALCRDILQSLRNQASGERQEMTLQGFVTAAVERMEVVHPSRKFVLDFRLDERRIKAPPTLHQVLVNLLDNAAQAARHTISLTLHDAAGECCIDIDDDGPGIAPDVARRLGQPFVTDKAEGMGIGYFLSHASINPLGGHIELSTRPEGGTRTRLCLPWRALESHS